MTGHLRGVAQRYLQPLSRQRKLRYARARMEEWGVESVLLVGVHPDPAPGFDNMIELGIQKSAQRCVAVGLEPTRSAGEWADYRVADGLDLPFQDGEFDLAYSNAVIEHVGSEADQRRFVAELDRVARNWITTTPNRWFPVELHTYAVMTHWRRRWRDAPPPGISRLLGPRDLQDLIPRGRVMGGLGSATLTAVSD